MTGVKWISSIDIHPQGIWLLVPTTYVDNSIRVLWYVPSDYVH